MRDEYTRRCFLCLINEREVAPFLKELKPQYPNVEMALFPHQGSVEILFQGSSSLEPLVAAVQKRFPTFFYGEGRIEDALHREFIHRKKTLSLAESCTGGAISAKLAAIPDASKYFLGSIVAYSNAWKERFLEVSRTTLKEKGAVSKEAVIEMVRGLFQATDADLAAAVSGIAGPGGGSLEKPVGTVYIAIGERGHKIDAGVIHAPQNRSSAIEMASSLTLGGLWRKLVHAQATFS